MRLIDADKIIKWADDSVAQYGGTYSTDMLNMFGLFKHIIDNAPTVDTRGDLIKRNLAIAYATSGLIRKIDGEDWIRTSEVKQSLNDVPTVKQEVYMTGEDYDLFMRGYKQARKDFEGNQGEWKRHDEWRNGEYVGGFYHVNCPCENCYFVKWPMNYCGNCGTEMKRKPRDCEHCKHYVERDGSQGCESWDCHFEDREDG